jgi:hypothetical protein
MHIRKRRLVSHCGVKWPTGCTCRNRPGWRGRKRMAWSVRSMGHSRTWNSQTGEGARAILVSYIHYYIHFSLFAANRSRPPVADHLGIWLVSAKYRT